MTEHDIVDPAVLMELVETTGGDRAFVGELVETYVADSPGLLADMRQAILVGDAGQVRRLAHSLKSSSASLGARQLAELCQDLERRARAGLLEDGETRVSRIETVYAEVGPTLQAFVSTG